MPEIAGPTYVTPRIMLLTANNGDEFTLSGTNTWIALSPDGAEAVIIDPGPIERAHEDSIVAAVAHLEVKAIVLTHAHDDHSDLAPRLHTILRAPILARDPRFVRGGSRLESGHLPECGAVDIRVMVTPGHTSDSISLHFPEQHALATGDTFLGGSSTTLDFPDADLADYLGSLQRLIDVAAESDVRMLLPGHGAVDMTPVESLEAYRRHRLNRLEHIRSLVATGITGVDSILDRTHPGVTGLLRAAAGQNVQAALQHLATNEGMTR